MTVRVAVQKDGVTAEDLRFAFQALITPAGALNARSGVLPNAGIPADLVSVSALSAKVTPFQAWVDGSSNALQAGYLLTSDADVTLTFGAGNGTNPRIDLVVARIRDNPYDASLAQTGTVEVVAGTPAASPVVPALPASSVALWQVLVPAAASGGSPINFASARTDRRTYTGLAGALFPIASSTERAAVVSPYAGMPIYRSDTKNIEIYDGTNWLPQNVVPVASAAARNAVFAAPFSGAAVWRTDTKVIEVYDGAAWRIFGPTGATTDGAWTAFTPTWTALTLGTGATNQGRYARFGGMITAQYNVVLGTGGLASGSFTADLPVPAAAAAMLHVGTAYSNNTGSTTRRGGMVELNAGASTIVFVGTADGLVWNGTVPHTWASGSALRVETTYEAA